MPEIPASLAEFATRELRGRGMEIRTEHDARRRSDADAVTLSTGERIPTRLLCWTAGVQPAPVVRELGLPLGARRAHRGRRHDARGGQRRTSGRSATPPRCPTRPSAAQAPSPPTAQHAIRQGRRVAENVAATLRRRAAAAVPLPDARRVRRHGPAQGRRDDARRAAARLPGLVRGAHLPPGDDARAWRGRCGSWWTGRSGLVFGRASAELGQLGHPPVLERRARGEAEAEFR